MTTSRVLHFLRGPATSPAPADRRRGPRQPQRLRFAPAGDGMRRVSVACSSSSSTSGEDEGMTYKGAGVDIDAGTELVRRIRKMAPGIGGFGGLYPFGIHCRHRTFANGSSCYIRGNPQLERGE